MLNRTSGLVCKGSFQQADEILNIGKSPYADPLLVTTLLSVRLPLFLGMRVKLGSNYSNELAHQVMARNCWESFVSTG
jgi:hypothetical protein